MTCAPQIIIQSICKYSVGYNQYCEECDYLSMAQISTFGTQSRHINSNGGELIEDAYIYIYIYIYIYTRQ